MDSVIRIFNFTKKFFHIIWILLCRKAWQFGPKLWFQLLELFSTIFVWWFFKVESANVELFEKISIWQKFGTKRRQSLFQMSSKPISRIWFRVPVIPIFIYPTHHQFAISYMQSFYGNAGNPTQSVMPFFIPNNTYSYYEIIFSWY